mmetsp:Transcript_54494/g.151902  ORF Transcript_54494/g.151902 Transcript_54494/m.151902 type:complete len:282 (+) Transcript_54494:988-1833(+)
MASCNETAGTFLEWHRAQMTSFAKRGSARTAPHWKQATDLTQVELEPVFGRRSSNKTSHFGFHVGMNNIFSSTSTHPCQSLTVFSMVRTQDAHLARRAASKGVVPSWAARKASAPLPRSSATQCMQDRVGQVPTAWCSATRSRASRALGSTPALSSSTRTISTTPQLAANCKGVAVPPASIGLLRSKSCKALRTFRSPPTAARAPAPPCLAAATRPNNSVIFDASRAFIDASNSSPSWELALLPMPTKRAEDDKQRLRTSAVALGPSWNALTAEADSAKTA